IEVSETNTVNQENNVVLHGEVNMAELADALIETHSNLETEVILHGEVNMAELADALIRNS
ncbi:hypothetical protein LOAG_07749, partial [Loa loa]